MHVRDNMVDGAEGKPVVKYATYEYQEVVDKMAELDKTYPSADDEEDRRTASSAFFRSRARSIFASGTKGLLSAYATAGTLPESLKLITIKEVV